MHDSGFIFVSYLPTGPSTLKDVSMQGGGVSVKVTHSVRGAGEACKKWRGRGEDVIKELGRSKVGWNGRGKT